MSFIFKDRILIMHNYNIVYAHPVQIKRLKYRKGESSSDFFTPLTPKSSRDLASKRLIHVENNHKFSMHHGGKKL